MSYLLDTSVLSEARRPRQDDGVRRWIARTPSSLQYLSVLTVGEIARGIARLHQRGDEQQAAAHEGWLEEVVGDFADRIVAVDSAIAREWGEQTIRQPVPIIDGLIAATAKVRGWTLVTRNVKDVERTGVRLLNPFSV